jgi:hypothetical protein
VVFLLPAASTVSSLGQGLPLAALICAIKLAEGPLPGDVAAVCVQHRVVRGQIVFFLSDDTCYMEPSSPGPTIDSTSIYDVSDVC